MNKIKHYTQKPDLILKEYGRNVQKLVEYVCQIEDREKRTSYAHTLIDLISQTNLSIRNPQERSQRLWDDLYIMSGFNLDVDSPFSMPDKSDINKKPQKVGYDNNHIRYKHYGRNMELLIKEVISKKDPEDKKMAIIYLGRLMKNLYTTWNKDNVDDIVILQNIKELSKGELSISLGEAREHNMFDTLTVNNNQRRDTNGIGSGKNSNRGRVNKNQNRRRN